MRKIRSKGVYATSPQDPETLAPSNGNYRINIDNNANETDRAFIVSHDAGTELFRIQEDGKVGIGTTTPDAKLDVELSSGPAAEIGDSSCSATGNLAIAMGRQTTASGDCSFAMGYKTKAEGVFSVAMGEETKASGYASFAMGMESVASGDWSFAMGCQPVASGYASVAIGTNSVASGDCSIVAGGLSEASGWCSFAIGIGAVASGSYSYARGFSAEASGHMGSTAIGADVTASGHYGSTAIGDHVTASGNHSFASGLFVTAGPADHTFVFGSGDIPDRLVNNIEDSFMVGFGSTTPTLFVDGSSVGIGTTNPQRALHVVDVLRLEPRSSEPSSPSEGDIYVNSSDHHIYCYLNYEWKQLDNEQ